jgi:hypothetical protein
LLGSVTGFDLDRDDVVATVYQVVRLASEEKTARKERALRAAPAARIGVHQTASGQTTVRSPSPGQP